MVMFFWKSGMGSISIDKNLKISINLEFDDTILPLIQKEAANEISCLQRFKLEGIPGKMKLMKKVENEEDLVTLIKKISKDYPEYCIYIREETRYTLLKCSTKYDYAKFIVKDNNLNKQTVFNPYHCDDLIWFNYDLCNDENISDWDFFGYDSDDLEFIDFSKNKRRYEI
jgi:hypothetical protein